MIILNFLFVSESAGKHQQSKLTQMLVTQAEQK